MKNNTHNNKEGTMSTRYIEGAKECPLTDAELEVLVDTRDDQLLKVFGDKFKRSELRKWKRWARANHIGFRKFLRTGRTEQELKERFPNYEELLEVDYPGLYLFEQRNNYHERVFILLPEYHEKVEVKERIWHVHRERIARGDDEIPGLYQVIQFPEDVFVDDKLVVVPLFDVHYGHEAHRHEKFLEYVRWIEETPNVFVILGGDLMENALDDGRGMTYDQEHAPQSQLDNMTKLLAPIAHKCLLITPGNHEWRTFNKSGLDPTKALADRLNIPYFSGPSVTTLLAGSRKWSIYTFHGKGNSQTKGGKINAAGRPRKFMAFCNFYLSGHVHDPLTNKEVRLVEDPLNCRMLFMTEWVIIAQSFLHWYGTYAYRAGYPPGGKGGVALEMFRNGDYRAVETS